MVEVEIKKSNKRDYLVWASLVLIILNLILIFLTGSLVFGDNYVNSNTRNVPENVVARDGESSNIGEIIDVEVSDENSIVKGDGSCVLREGFSCPEGADKNICETAGCVPELGGENNEINLCYPVVCSDFARAECSGNCVWDENL